MQRLFFLFLLVYSFSAFGQKTTTILSNADTTDLHNAMDTESMQISAEDDQAMKDSLTKAGYALKRLKDVITLKKNVLWGTTLSAAIKNFQDTTYVLISPLMKMEGRGVLIGLVSKVGEINLFDPIDPYINIYWIMKPVTDQELPFTLELEIENSETLPDDLFEEILLAIEPIYKGKKYNEVAQTETDVLTATVKFLDLLKAKIGDDYAPKYLFQVDGNEYRSGHKMNIFEPISSLVDPQVAIYLIDRITKQTVQSGITWDGAEVEGYHAYIEKDSIGTHVITAAIEDTLEYTFTLNIIGDDILSVITQSAQSVFEAALLDAMQILVDSAQAKEDEYQENKTLSDDMREQMRTKLISVSGTNTSGNPTLLYATDSTEFVDEAIPEGIKTHQFLGQYINKATAEHLARVAFIFAWTNRQVLLEFTQDASKRAAFRDAVMDDIGTLAADITIALITGDAAEIKEFLVGFIIEKVNATTTAQLSSN